MHVASVLDFPQKIDWPRLLRVLLQKSDTRYLTYCAERNAAFYEFCFLKHKAYRQWSIYIMRNQSMMVLDACIAFSVATTMFFIRKILTSKATLAIFSKLWLHCFTNVFDPRNDLHKDVVLCQIDMMNFPVLDFLTGLPSFRFELNKNLQRIFFLSPPFIDWLLRSRLKLDYLLPWIPWSFPHADQRLIFRILDDTNEISSLSIHSANIDMNLRLHKRLPLLRMIQQRYDTFNIEQSSMCGNLRIKKKCTTSWPLLGFFLFWFLVFF